MSQSVWDSDFGAVFKQRYDILKGIDIKKGVMGAVGGAVGHMVDPSGIVGPAIGGGLGAEFDKAEKMEKEEEEFPGSKGLVRGGRRPITDKSYKTDDVYEIDGRESVGEEKARMRRESKGVYKSLHKAVRSIDRVLKEMRVVDTGLKGERVGEIRHDSNPKGGYGGGTTAPRPKERKQPIKKEEAFSMSMDKSLRKSIKSVTKMLHKLDSCGGSTAGLNIKHVTAKKEGGGVYPAKAPPKPKTKRA